VIFTQRVMKKFEIVAGSVIWLLICFAYLFC